MKTPKVIFLTTLSLTFLLPLIKTAPIDWVTYIEQLEISSEVLKTQCGNLEIPGCVTCVEGENSCSKCQSGWGLKQMTVIEGSNQKMCVQCESFCEECVGLGGTQTQCVKCRIGLRWDAVNGRCGSGKIFNGGVVLLGLLVLSKLF